MKRFLATIISLVYLLNFGGITIHQHYCMGELVRTSIFPPSDEKCGKCGMDKESEAASGCCQDVSQSIKSNESHTQKLLNAGYLSHPPCILPSVNDYQTNVGYQIIPELSDRFRVSDPPIHKQPLFLQNRSFRI